MASFTNPNLFGRRLAEIGEIVERNAGDVLRGTALVVDQVLVTETPVLTGRARSGWHVGIGTEPSFVPQGEPSSPEAGQSSALKQAENTINRWKTGGPEIYISNGLPYIRRLNDGYSAQAPTGMVEHALQAGEEFANKQLLLKGL